MFTSLWLRWHRRRQRRDTVDVYVNTAELTAGQPARIREIEYQQQLDQESKVLRVSGKVPAAAKTIPAVEQRGRQ